MENILISECCVTSSSARWPLAHASFSPLRRLALAVDTPWETQYIHPAPEATGAHEVTMNETFERLGTSEVKIQVDIPWSELKPRYDESLSKLRGTIQVRGFRKGRVPASMLEKMMGDRIVLDVAVEEIAGVVQKIIAREKIFPLRIPLDIEKDVRIAADRAASFESRVEVLPMVDRIGFEGIELMPRKQTTEADIDERLRRMAARKAPLKTSPDDHEIGEYDQVVLDGEAEFMDDNQKKPVTDLRVDLAPWTQPPPGLVQELLGKKKGHRGETTLVLPLVENPGKPDYRYAKLSYGVTQVMTRELPPLDEELARDFDMESLADLRNEIREVIEKESFDEYVSTNGGHVLDQLVQRSTFDLPPTYRLLTEMRSPSGDGGGEGETPDEQKQEQQKAMTEAFEKMLRRNLLTMIISQQNGLSLPTETVNLASERMKGYIDSQDGSRKEKDEAFGKWKEEFEQNLFNHMIASFLVQETEKALGIEPAGAPGDEHAEADPGENTTKEQEP